MKGFPLGQIVATPAAIRLLEENRRTMSEYLRRHARADWGDVCATDARLNDAALNDGSRLLSIYSIRNKQKIWIITEAQDERGFRAATTVLLPSEY